MSVVIDRKCTELVVSNYRNLMGMFPGYSDLRAIMEAVESVRGGGVLDARRLADVVISVRGNGGKVTDYHQVYTYVCHILREAPYCCRHQVDDGKYRVHDEAHCGSACDDNRGRAPKARVYDYGVCQDCCLTLPASGVCSWCND